MSPKTSKFSDFSSVYRETSPSKPEIYNLRIRLCANGADQTVDLEESCSPACLADSLRITIALAAAFGLCLSLTDVVNAYQNTMLN